MMNVNMTQVTRKMDDGFTAAAKIAADNEVYTFVDAWGFLQTCVGLAAYRTAVAESREAWRDSVGR